MRTQAAVFLFAALAVAADARGVTIAWTPVGNPGNAGDTAVEYDGSTGHGAVDYSYNIGTYDVTVVQYVAFLNQVDPTGANALGLYNTDMSSGTVGDGVIQKLTAQLGDRYQIVSADRNMPINYVTYYDTLRFANWLNNGQGHSSTETGAYTLLGGTPTPSNADSIVRNADATDFIPTEDEWYKAAYYNPATSSYYLYPTSSNTAPTGSAPTGVPNSANLDNAEGPLTTVGAYTGTTSPYGLYDTAGDVVNWTETLFESYWQVLRGTSFEQGASDAPLGGSVRRISADASRRDGLPRGERAGRNAGAEFGCAGGDRLWRAVVVAETAEVAGHVSQRESNAAFNSSGLLAAVAVPRQPDRFGTSTALSNISGNRRDESRRSDARSKADA